MIELVILDMYKTLWSSGLPSRKGLHDFFHKYQDRRFVVATDDPSKEAVMGLLEEIEIVDYIDKIYYGDDMITITGKYATGKDLGRMCSEYGVPRSAAVFIGDSDRDKVDARRERIQFIHVPEYKEEAEKFSFDFIDLDNFQPYKDLRATNS